MEDSIESERKDPNILERSYAAPIIVKSSLLISHCWEVVVMSYCRVVHKTYNLFVSFFLTANGIAAARTCYSRNQLPKLIWIDLKFVTDPKLLLAHGSNGLILEYFLAGEGNLLVQDKVYKDDFRRLFSVESLRIEKDEKYFYSLQQPVELVERPHTFRGHPIAFLLKTTNGKVFAHGGVTLFNGCKGTCASEREQIN